MITKFKLFEAEDEGIPEIGDYVTDSPNPNRIGKIHNKNISDKYWTVHYLDKNLAYFIDFDKVTHWSKNIEDLEPYILANKYNIG